jgi:hypothetical protein
MFKNPRFYLKALAGWLLLTNFGHTFLGVPELLDQAADSSSANFPAFSAMSNLPRGGFFEYSIFEIFFLGMLAIFLLLLFATLVSLWVALKGNSETVSQFSLLNFIFWGFALLASIVFHPVDNMVVIALGAFLLSGLAFWRARKET